jgi:sugar phosphate isomerase/epimerase
MKAERAVKPVKLTFSTLACPTWSFPQIVGAAAAHGLEGIDLRGIGDEIDITRLPLFDSELDATLELLASHGLSLPCLNTSVALLTPAAEHWSELLEECHRYAVLAGRVGASFLRVFGGEVPREMPCDHATLMARRRLAQLAKICAAQGCQVLVETHDDWATGGRLMELLGEFAPEEAGALWDVEHPFRAGERPGQTAAALGRYVRHVHLKDSRRRSGKSMPRLLGQGELPLAEVVGALRSMEYDRWVCLEMEKRWHPEDAPEPEESLPQFVQWMRENWPVVISH